MCFTKHAKFNSTKITEERKTNKKRSPDDDGDDGCGDDDDDDCVVRGASEMKKINVCKFIISLAAFCAD